MAVEWRGADESNKLDRQQTGWLGEVELDRALLTGSQGRLMPFLPIPDTHKVDRAYSWDGIGAPHFVQVKASSDIVRPEVFFFVLRAAGFEAYERLWIAALPIDPLSSRFCGEGWLFPSKDLVRLAAHHYDHEGRIIAYNWIANLHGKDKFAAYRHPVEGFTSVLEPARQTASTSLRSPWQGTEGGAVYEWAFVAELLRGGVHELAVYRPASDIAGRDFVVQLVNSPRAMYVQIKGTTMTTSAGGFGSKVNRLTFVPRTDFWFVFFFYDVSRQTIFEECWLVPSRDFARLTAGQRAEELSFFAHLDREKDEWQAYRHPFRSQAEVLRTALKELPV